MRADTGTPELGITGVDLDLFCPRGEWGETNAAQEQWSMRSAKQEHRHAGCETTLLETASGRNDSTNQNLQKKKNRETEARSAIRKRPSVVVLV
jgi:hypothetical protein